MKPRLLFLLAATVSLGVADEPAKPAAAGAKVSFKEDFEKGSDRWQPTDPAVWAVTDDHGGKVLELTKKVGSFKPPHRSPFTFALLKDVSVGSFTFTAKVRSTTNDYPHRDACIIFNYQNPAQFYYVHLGLKTDDHANQIFIVNKADRTKISSKTSPGTPWKNDTWHDVKIERDADAGTIKIYFDDMKTPCMEATDKNFTSGQIGIGSFDDTVKYDDVSIEGAAAPVPAPAK